MGVSSHNKSAEEINTMLIKFVPELKSSYATYPLNGDRCWYGPNDTGLQGEPCFIAFGSEPSQHQGGQRKLDYAFGNGSLGIGYYSLLTQDSYIILHGKVANMVPPNDCCYCCVYSSRARKEYDDWEDVKRILYNRKIAPKPHDAIGAQAAEATI